MSSGLQEYGFYYLWILTTIAIIVTILFISGSYLTVKNKLYSKRPNTIGYSLLILSLVIVLTSYIVFFQIETKVPEKLNLKSEKDSSLTEVQNCNINIDKENGFVEKKLKPIILETGEKYRKTYTFLHDISKFTKKTNKNKVTLIDLFLYSLVLNYHWESIKIRENLYKESPFFSRIYDVEDKDYYWKEDYVPYEIGELKNIDKEKIKRQILQLDLFLSKKNLYLSDVHEDNVRIDKLGNIKIIDGEIFSNKHCRQNGYFLHPRSFGSHSSWGIPWGSDPVNHEGKIFLGSGSQ